MSDHDPFEDQVRRALAEKAASVRPSGGGYEAIQRKLESPSAVRRWSQAPWLAAAAAVVVIALVGGVLVSRDDDGPDETEVAAGEDGGAVPTAHPELLDAVWPTDDPDELLGISAAYVKDPAATAAAYLADRLERPLTAENITLDSGGGDANTTATATLTDGPPQSVELGWHPAPGSSVPDAGAWYVSSATSGLLELHDVEYTGDGITGSIHTGAPGSLEISIDGDSGGTGWTDEVDAEEDVSLDTTMSSSGAPTPLNVRARLTGDAGNTVVAEVHVFPQGWFPAPDDVPTAPDAPTAEALGVWPKPVDEIPADVLSDPVDTAARYIEETAGASNGVVLSELRQGDSNSGEVEVTGDYEATIALRQVEGRWHVEAVHTPQVEARGDVPGELWLHANEEGLLSVTVLDAWGTVVQSMPGKHMAEGEEVVVVPAEPVHKPFTVRYRFEPTAGGGFGLGDVAVVGTHEQAGTATEPDVEHAVPDGAIYAAGGVDPIGTAQEYIRARLGFIPDDMHLVGDFTGENNGTVDWQDGSVFLAKSDGYWYVTESIGSSVSFDRVALPTVEVFLGEAGVLLVQLLDAEGGVCTEQHTDVDGRGPVTVTFDDVPCDPASVVATMNDVVAEQRI